MRRWLKTVLLVIFGGAIGSSIEALMDPTKYRFPQDLGSGRMWRYFIGGAVVAGITLFFKRSK